MLQLAVDRPELLEPITEAPVYLRVEAAYAAAAEGALHLEDILSRRMRISIEYPHRGVDCAREVAETVAPILNWSPADVDREVLRALTFKRKLGLFDNPYVPVNLEKKVRVSAANRNSIGDYGNLNAPRTFGIEMAVKY